LEAAIMQGRQTRGLHKTRHTGSAIFTLVSSESSQYQQKVHPRSTPL